MLTLELIPHCPPASGPQALQDLLRGAGQPPVVAFTGPARKAATTDFAAVAVAADSCINLQVLPWMPVAVPMATVALRAGIALIWVPA